MVYGTQITAEASTVLEAQALRDALATQHGTIRVGTGAQWTRQDGTLVSRHFAYAVMADDPGEGTLPDGMRRVALVGADARTARILID